MNNKHVIIREAANGYIISISQEVDLDFSSLQEMLPAEMVQVPAGADRIFQFLKKAGAMPTKTQEIIAKDKDELLKHIQVIIGGW